MVEIGWLVKAFSDAIGSPDQGRDTILRRLDSETIDRNRALSADETMALLDQIKNEDDLELARLAASTLKVRIMMLLTAKGRLSVN